MEYVNIHYLNIVAWSSNGTKHEKEVHDQDKIAKIIEILVA